MEINLPHPQPRIEWLKAYLEANTMNEPFEDVYVVTARTEATEKQATAIKEYVQVAESGIRVCINADSTEDSDAMCRALDMVADALDQLDGQYGTISFGDTLQFDLIAQ